MTNTTTPNTFDAALAHLLRRRAETLDGLLRAATPEMAADLVGFLLVYDQQQAASFRFIPPTGLGAEATALWDVFAYCVQGHVAALGLILDLQHDPCRRCLGDDRLSLAAFHLTYAEMMSEHLGELVAEAGRETITVIVEADIAAHEAA